VRGLLLLSAITLAVAFASPNRALHVAALPKSGAVSRRSVSQLQPTTMAAQRLVLWFRNDLRLHDNYIIAEAAKKMSSNRKLEVPFPRSPHFPYYVLRLRNKAAAAILRAFAEIFFLDSHSCPQNIVRLCFCSDPIFFTDCSGVLF